MHPHNANPKWWQVYFTMPLLAILFIAENRLKISSRGHEFVQIGIILLVYGLIHLWIKANSSTLSQLDRRQHHGRIMVIQIDPLQLPESGEEKRRLFKLPDSEVKGMLSSTFEMDYIETDSLSSDEVSQK